MSGELSTRGIKAGPTDEEWAQEKLNVLMTEDSVAEVLRGNNTRPEFMYFANVNRKDSIKKLKKQLRGNND